MTPHLARTIARMRRRGFTLVELLVAMVAGLLVALAIVGLSKEANNTFQEEGRVAVAESQLRTAIDRLRADVQRASFMSTANILADPNVASQAGQPKNNPIPVAMAGLRGLQGIRLFTGGSNAPLSQSAQNGLSPDAIQLAGNFTSVEQVIVDHVDTTTANPCGGQRIYLETRSSPSLWRLVGMGEAGTSTAYDLALESAFQPVHGGSGDGGAGNGQFIVRLTDQTGYSQYLATCATPAGAAWNTGAPYIDLDPSTPLWSLQSLGGAGAAKGGVQGNCTGCVVNPVQIVRWSIGPAVLNPTSDPSKYDLTRQYIGVDGNPVGAAELIAEYAIDLKFAFVVDSNTNGDVTGASAKLTSYDFGNANNQTYGDDVTIAGRNQQKGPQRIRAVRVRLATRAAVMDRAEALDAGAGYTYRYCVAMGPDGGTGTCTTGSTQWARARTVITEVALPNQARLYWP